MIAIDDPHLPGLSGLDPERLCRATGAEDVAVMRVRYRAGERAVLHVETAGRAEFRQGAVWFFRGDKARRIARDNPAARYDEATGALYEAFPDDHRMPQIRRFLESYRALAPALLGAPPYGDPQLIRYRPGLSCTFRCASADGDPVYVKLVNGEDPRRLAVLNRAIGDMLRGSSVSVAPAIATEPGVSAISYAAARGRPLDAALARAGSIAPLRQSVAALGRLWRLNVTPARLLSSEALRRSAAECAAMVAVLSPTSAAAAGEVLARLDAEVPQLACRPIHADIKLEHLFLDGGHTTLIDTESLSMGPPDYDLAQLCGRLWQTGLDGLLPAPLVAEAEGEIRRSAGPGFGWCLGVAALRLARFHAQRPGADSAARIAAILARLG